MEKFLTLHKYGEARLIEKKSLFIGQAAPALNEREALDFIDHVKEKYHDAHHHAFAYLIGENEEIQRYHDGGEPSGTAGRPVFEMIRTGQLTNVVIVVTRYFGGTLLGTGGLVRAYGTAAHQAVQKAGIIEKALGREIFTEIEYHLEGKVRNYLSRAGVFLKSISYADKVYIVCYLKAAEVESFLEDLNDISHGSAKIDLGNELFFNLHEE
ncbi:IMPACT family protein [Candidatus Formimonas warabiya]|uniref:YigZ family protein n=1 Tax=Formimonas warabiya TaxID=1761012 RepID=A0A3G1KMN0_FORW1|nr:YigZ family protein [Candidatus Formimonas warabiya]ATW23684.1 hypothetical protein DCMF_01755 [Candidatus Formimonas warabiya]